MPAPTQLLVGGKFRDAISGKTFSTINPATEEVLAEVAEADGRELGRHGIDLYTQIKSVWVSLD